nr:hypothetical protein CFP56_00144 [Quercus suber]
MQTTILTFAALAAAVVADLGTGSIVNSCDYEVNLDNVPAGGNGQESYSTVLSANGGTYSQDWTSLAIGGWSMKVNPTFNQTSVMQFEYSYSDANPDNLWFDLSYVNGNPFAGAWLISSSSDDCIVKQTAYANPTDDANGMQRECTPDVSITVTLCPSNGDDAGSVISSVVSSVLEPLTSVATSSETSVSATTTPAAANKDSPLDTNYFDQTTTTSTPSPTTFATQTTSLSTDDSGAVVTEVDTVVATQVVTVYGHGHHFQRHAHAHGRH